MSELSEYFTNSKIWKREYWNNRECIYIDHTPIIVTEHNCHYYLSISNQFPYYGNEIKTVKALLKKIDKLLNKKETQLNNNLNSFIVIKNKIKKELGL